MKHWLAKTLFVAALWIPVFSSGQDVDSHSPKNNDPITKQQRSAEKKKAKRAANAEKAERQFQKDNMKLQTKEVRKRMKKNRKKADKWNETK